MPGIFTGSPFLSGMALDASLILAIGPQNAYVLRQGIRQEHVPLTILVCVFVELALVSTGVEGLAAGTTHIHWLLVKALMAAGILFLLVYGVKAAKRALSNETLAVQAMGERKTRLSVIFETLAISLLNPHVILDTVVIMGAAGASLPTTARHAFIGGTICTAAIWFTTVGIGAKFMAPLLKKPVAWRILDALVAILMGSAAVSMAMNFTH